MTSTTNPTLRPNPTDNDEDTPTNLLSQLPTQTFTQTHTSPELSGRGTTSSSQPSTRPAPTHLKLLSTKNYPNQKFNVHPPPPPVKTLRRSILEEYQPSTKCQSVLMPSVFRFSKNSSLWTKRCASTWHTVWDFQYINYVGCFDLHASLWAQILGASEAILAAILAQILQNFSHMYQKVYVCLLTDTYPNFTKFRMGKIDNNLFHCSAHWNTRKTC